ncbi:hypothetical protein DPMN_011774 [Dreissena polymorpha]|uniref:Uncharacterized protein n=1 Tax=Dreissena polymorpha TaxID=45954 RepID=A0A9D4N4R8_DREPO|nr:hypothetical protein DPMN_011774 [Dreissena polymorpha]
MPPPGSHVFQATETIFIFSKIIGLLSVNNFVSTLTRNIFKLVEDIIRTNVPTKIHEDWTINVTFRVRSSFYHCHKRKNALPPDGHVIQPTGTIFELIISTNFLINVVVTGEKKRIVKKYDQPDSHKPYMDRCHRYKRTNKP